MSITDEGLADLFEQYKDEVKETIETLDTELVTVEQDPTSSEVIFAIFRNLHSLKGSSKMFNVDNIGHIAHKLEDLMQLIDQDNTILGQHPKIVELLFKGNDIFRDIISRLETDISYLNLTPGHAKFIEEINRQLDIISRKEDGLVESAKNLLSELEAMIPGMEETDIESLRRAMDDLAANIKLMTMDKTAGNIKYSYGGLDITDHITEYESGLAKFKSEKFNQEDIDQFFQNTEEMLQMLFEVAEEGIMDLLGELNDGLEMYNEKMLEIDPIIIEFLTLTLDDLKGQLKAEAAAPMEVEVQPTDQEAGAAEAKGSPVASAIQKQAKTIRVDESKIDLFLDSVGKLITQSEILNHLQYSFKGAGLNPSLVRDFASINRTISNDIINLQRSIMEVRQVEMDNILKKFPRLVRDISRKMDKDVELVISGERVPIDKSLLDDVEQAMIHIIRNSIDHGLETPKEREDSGKPARGTINIRVIQEEASIQVEIADDGRGIDYEAVRTRAFDKGLLTEENLEILTEDDILDFVFRSGLTTKEIATDISGRGVGLDVVMANIKRWNGEVFLENHPGQGLTIRLQIPITNTLLTKEAILFKLDSSIFCLPLEFVVEIVTIPAENIHRHRAQEMFQHRNQVINLMDIRGLLGLHDMQESDAQQKTVIILRGKTDSIKSIATDGIIGQQKIVIKDFDLEAFRRLPYFQGLTLLGDGRVVLVMDGEKIVD